ncbi:hypothetical protein TNCV_2418131 [Trichonephila clavipes]|nr:hypothetical protein TNCV_2418131 [Trichonephila clavipes]
MILSNSFSEAGDSKKRNVQLNKEKFDALTCLRYFLVVALQLGIIRPCVGWRVGRLFLGIICPFGPVCGRRHVD